MIEYNNATNEIILEPKRIPQTSGKITETIKVGGYSQEKSYFLELKCPKNKRYVTGKIDFSSGDGLIELPEAIINNVGDVYVQLVIRNTDGEVVGKSFVSDEPLYVIEQSINAVDDVADERVGDCLSSALKATENMVSFQKSLEEKLASGKLNGKDGTKVIVGGAEKESIAFTKDPQEQLKEKANLVVKTNLGKSILEFSDLNDCMIIMITTSYAKWSYMINDEEKLDFGLEKVFVINKYGNIVRVCGITLNKFYNGEIKNAEKHLLQCGDSYGRSYCIMR